MKKVMFLLSLIFCVFLAACSGGQNQNATVANKATAENSIASSQTQYSDNQSDRAVQKTKKSASSSAIMKQALMEEGNVQFVDDMEFEAVGDWSAADSRMFYKNCNMISSGKKNNPNLNVDKYCSCLKVIMLDNKYRPSQLNKAVRNEQQQVVSCLKTSLITNE